MSKRKADDEDTKDDKKRKYNKDKKHKCEDCDKWYSHKRTLWKHQQSQHEVKSEEKEKKGNECPVCGKVFTKISNMKRHQLTHKPEEKGEGKKQVQRFKCPICGKLYTRKDGAKRHIEAAHGNAATIVCEDCPDVKTFVSYDTYQRHYNSKHALKRIWCMFDGCRRLFTRRSYMLDHAKTCRHSPEGAEIASPPSSPSSPVSS